MTFRDAQDQAVAKPTSPAPPAPPTATPTPLPNWPVDAADSGSGPAPGSTAEKGTSPLPKLRLEIHNLDHPGAAKFLSAINPTTVLSTAIKNVLCLLYQSPTNQHPDAPPTRSVTLILRDMAGVAHTRGIPLDDDHKEIHLSLNYINSIHPPSRLAHEITGVITHEAVHCLQWDGLKTCPGGLVEGVADWVRLRCDLGPPHWRRETDGGWDRGYQHTAYFLQYLEARFGEGTVRRVNEKLRVREYKGESFWPELLGQSAEQLYGDYVEKSKGGE
ncbi:BSP-domain-containing protein [Trichocladium antarcticum]|uniref:BSP-domain-containing protein n=1 Tax=Trichocladium antarcticum TaxID=1450529 RepID=A0AAN6ZDV7_9PEZI|nr:BSP-domain-containing protein [Trichocladium antarcticum]